MPPLAAFIRHSHNGSGNVRVAANLDQRSPRSNGPFAMNTPLPPTLGSPDLSRSSAPEAEANATSDNAWRSEQLLHGQREVLIQHGQEFYRLRLTRAGKLILYK